MKIKNLFFLSILTTLLYMFIIEVSYCLNISYISISKYFSFTNYIFFKYLLFFLISAIFLFGISILINKYHKYFKHLRVYILISLVLLFIQNIFLLLFPISSNRIIFQVFLNQFLAIFFATTLFFYSIYYANLLK